MKLVIFDVDGTLIDSQSKIVAAMGAGFAAAGLDPLPREEILSIVGLSLPVAIARLLPKADEAQLHAVAQGYRDSFLSGQIRDDAPLYDGARGCLDRFAGREDVVLGLATGKGRRGLDAMIAHHDLGGYFITRQCADEHPSKPHPSMIEAALLETGIDPRDAVMIGDTSFDLDMAASAGIVGIGVAWGYHDAASLRASGSKVAQDFAELTKVLEDWAA